MSTKSYTITEFRKIDSHITFIRVNPNDLKLTLKEIFVSLSDLSWLRNFDEDYVRAGIEIRSKNTLLNLEKKLLNGDTDKISSNTGETIVSELARKSIINKMGYLDIPLAEFFKQKKDGNPGFDFFTENKNETVLYGEAKYIAGKNGYGRAFNQIVDFITVGKDISDIPDIRDFCSPNSLINANKGVKGYIAAFSSTNIETDILIKNIKANLSFIELSNHKEIICVAVNVNI